jgi:hypothetical protein
MIAPLVVRRHQILLTSCRESVRKGLTGFESPMFEIVHDATNRFLFAPLIYQLSSSDNVEQVEQDDHRNRNS